MRFRAGFANLVVVQIENRRHGAGSDRNGFLHGSRAQTHERHRIRQGKNSCRHQRRVFTQAVPGDNGRLSTTVGQPEAVGGDGRRQHQRLRVDRLSQQLGWPLGDKLPQILIQRPGGLVEGSPHH